MKGLKAGASIPKVAGVTDRDRLFGGNHGERTCDGRGLPIRKVKSWETSAGDPGSGRGKLPVYGLVEDKGVQGEEINWMKGM